MKLIKYILFIIILIISAVFIMQLDAMNILSDGSKTMIKIPYLTSAVGFDNGLLAILWIDPDTSANTKTEAFTNFNKEI